MTKERKRALEAVLRMEQAYPDAFCSLMYNDPLHLLIATRLAAQCTDARVNMVTPALFQRFPNITAFANATPADVEPYIQSCGLYKTKAKDIVALCQKIEKEFGGEVPNTMEGLISLPGIGRKTANLVLGDIYGQPAVVVDTHFTRLCNRLGFVNTKDPKKIEFIMRDLLPADKSNDFCHRAVVHGRAVCTARKAMCQICCLQDICPKKGF